MNVILFCEKQGDLDLKLIRVGISGYEIKYLTGLKLRNADIKEMKFLIILPIQNPFENNEEYFSREQEENHNSSCSLSKLMMGKLLLINQPSIRGLMSFLLVPCHVF